MTTLLSISLNSELQTLRKQCLPCRHTATNTDGISWRRNRRFFYFFVSLDNGQAHRERPNIKLHWKSCLFTPNCNWTLKNSCAEHANLHRHKNTLCMWLTNTGNVFYCKQHSYAHCIFYVQCTYSKNPLLEIKHIYWSGWMDTSSLLNSHFSKHDWRASSLVLASHAFHNLSPERGGSCPVCKKILEKWREYLYSSGPG